MSCFDEKLDRRGTNCMKWDVADKAFEAEDVIPMWVADMDFATPRAITEAIIRRATHGAFGYNVVPQSYYDSIINWIGRRHDWHIEKDWIVYTPGVIPALYWAVGAFTKPGEKVLVQSPVYYVFYNAIAARKRDVVCNELMRTEHGYRIDFEDLEQKLADPSVTLMIFCSPHNPVGRVWTRQELEQVSDLCRKHHVLLVSDEIHSDLVWKGHKHIPIASVSQNSAQNTITCTAPSKTFNLAGLSTANAIIPNKDIRDRFCEERRTSAIHAPDTFGMVALQAAYDHGEVWLEDLLEYLAENYACLETYLAEHIPEIKPLRPEGTYLIWLDFSALNMNKEELKSFLNREARVAMDQGPWFGAGGDGFARMNIACHRSTLLQALARLENAIRNRAPK